MTVRLIPHPSGRSRNWYVRILAPSAIRHLVLNPDVRRTTGTPDRNLAKAHAARIEAEVRADWQRALDSAAWAQTPVTPTTLTREIIQHVCNARLSSWIHTDDDRYGRGFDDDELAELEAFCRHTDAEMRSVLAQGQASNNWEVAVELVLDFLVGQKHDVALTDPLFPELMRRFATVEKLAQKVIAERNAGEAAEFPEPAPASGPCLSEMVSAYQAHRDGTMGAKSISKTISIWNRFVAFRGDVALDSVTSDDLYRFLDARLRAEQQPWSQGYVDGPAQRALKEMFALARTQRKMTAPNPVTDLETRPRLSKRDQAARKRPRFPLKGTQLTTLFASDWYDPSASHWRGKMSTDLAARYWVPLLMMAHGFRVREPLQFVGGDFVFEDGHWMMTVQTDFTGTAAETSSGLLERSLKNEATHRTVPVHPLLLSLGFGQFIDDIQSRDAASAPIFASALPAPGGKAPMWGRAYEQAFLRHLRDRLGFGSGFGNHSFRHQLEDRIRDAQARNGAWPPGLASMYTGRKLTRDEDRAFSLSQGSAGDYGEGFRPIRLLPFARQITFDDVVLPPPFDQWLRR